MDHEREVYLKLLPKTGGAIRPKKKADKYSLTKNGQKHVLGRCKTSRSLQPNSLKNCFYSPEAREYMQRDYRREECLRIGVYHSCISRTDPGGYTLRMYLKVWLIKKGKMLRQGRSCAQEGFRS